MPVRRRTALLPAALIALAALALGACGGEEESSETTAAISLADWTDEVNTLCNEAQDTIDQLDEPSGSDDFTVIVASGSEIIDIATTFVGDVEALGSPAESAATAKELVQVYEDYTAGLEDVVAAAESEDEAAVDEALAGLDDTVSQRDELADELGLTECVSSEDTATDDTATDDTAIDDTGSNLPADEWALEIDAACSDLTTKYEGIGETQPQTEAELQQLANDVNAFAGEIVAAFDEIGPPAGDTTQAQALYDQFLALQETTTALADAAATQDAAAAQAAATELETIGAEINPLASELGVPSCGGF